MTVLSLAVIGRHGEINTIVSALSPLGRMQEAQEKGTPKAGLVSIQRTSERDAPNAIVS
jgi:hypothetical protein